MVNILSILCGSLYPRLSEFNNRNKQNLKADDQYSPLNGRGVRAPWRPSLSHVEKCNALNASLLIPFHFIFFSEWNGLFLFCFAVCGSRFSTVGKMRQKTDLTTEGFCDGRQGE